MCPLCFLDNKKCRRLLSQWGISLAPNLTTLHGRRFGPEKITLGSRTIVAKPQGYWTRNVFEDVLVTVDLPNWLLVCTDSTKAEDFVKCLTSVGQKMGIKINPPKTISLQYFGTDYLIRIREEISPAVSIFFEFLCLA